MDDPVGGVELIEPGSIGAGGAAGIERLGEEELVAFGGVGHGFLEAAGSAALEQVGRILVRRS